jgi:hypothetical protein
VNTSTRTLLASLSGVALATMLVGCIPSIPEAPPAPPAASEPADDEVTDETTDEEPAASGDGPAWAKPFATTGDKIATITSDSYQVEVYQVGTAKASKTGQFVTPDGDPVIAVGDDIVFINYVITNTSGTEIPLTASLVNVTARYASWPYLQGMDSVVDMALFEEMQVNNSATVPGSGSAPYMWPAGSTFAYGVNFRYEAGGAITFKATLTPALPDGSLDHDMRQEGAADGVTA